MSPEEWETIIEGINQLQNPSMIMCLKVLAYTGIRVGDAVRLKVEDFSPDRSKFSYVEEKTGKPRRRHIPKILQDQLNDFFHIWGHFFKEGNCDCCDACTKERPGKFLFFAYKNQSTRFHMHKRSVSIKFRILCDKLGLGDTYYKTASNHYLRRISTHTLRHFFLWKIYKATGNDLVKTQQIIGHAKAETTAH